VEFFNWHKIIELQNPEELEIPVGDQDCLAVMILNKNLQILLVKENHHKDKPWSVVTETCDNNDRTVANVLQRAIAEEVTSNPENFSYIPKTYSSYQLDTGTKLHSVAVFCRNFEKADLKPVDPSEIIGYQWADLTKLDSLNQAEELEPEVVGFYQWMLQNLGTDGINF
jgi:hypothetical protein